jgi:hypothetical protein
MITEVAGGFLNPTPPNTPHGFSFLQHRNPDGVNRILSFLDSAALHPAYELQLEAFQWR